MKEIIIHLKVLKQLNITLNEYCVAAVIKTLSRDNNTVAPGWFYGSKEYLANTLSLSRQTIHSIINKLIEKNIIERETETSYLRITERCDKF
jgi:DNA-binding MarR family transcriptional regulator